jgi:hypothetical protein
METNVLMARIAALQEVQKRNPMECDVWKAASVELAPLFAEMAKRQALNNGEPNWRNWK